MKALFVFFCFLLHLSVFGQSSRLSEAIRSDPRFAFDPESKIEDPITFTPAPEVSKFTLRNLEEKFTKRSDPKDRITIGLMSMAENLGVNDITSGALSWRANEDASFRFRSSKILYKYNPRVLPHDPWVVLDKVFAQPVRFLASKTLLF